MRSSRGISRTVAVVAAIVIVIVGALAGVYLYYQSTPKPVDNVTLMLDYVPAGNHAPFYAALSNGYYKDAGISTTILPGTGSTAVLQAVASGKYDFGFADFSQLVIARSQGENVSAIGVIYYKNPISLFFLKSRNITSPQQLPGLTLCDNPGSLNQKIFPAFAQLVNIDPNSVKFSLIAAASLNPALINGQCDARMSFITAYPSVESLAEAAGQRISTMNYSSYGFKAYGLVLLTSDKLIKSNPDLVKRFVQATYRGLTWTVAHPADAVGILEKYHPELPVNQSLPSLKIAMSLYDVQGGTVIPNFDPGVVQTTISQLATYLQLKPVPSANEVYTNAFA